MFKSVYQNLLLIKSYIPNAAIPPEIQLKLIFLKLNIVHTCNSNSSIKESLVNLCNILWHCSLLEVIHNRFIVIDVYFDVALKCKHMLLVIDHHRNNPPKTNQWSVLTKYI